MSQEEYPFSKKLAQDLTNVISQCQINANENRNMNTNPFPAVSIPAGLVLKELSANDLADQLSVIDQKFFFQIKPRECLNQVIFVLFYFYFFL